MRSKLSILAGLGLALSAAPASAATILILADPLTLERRTVVIESSGPDRAYLCMLPPAVAGCQKIALKRGRI